MEKPGVWLGKVDVKQKKSRTKILSIHKEDFPISPFRGWNDLLPPGYWELMLQQQQIEGTLGETLEREEDG